LKPQEKAIWLTLRAASAGSRRSRRAASSRCDQILSDSEHSRSWRAIAATFSSGSRSRSRTGLVMRQRIAARRRQRGQQDLRPPARCVA
jgi:hypothetical protein